MPRKVLPGTRGPIATRDVRADRKVRLFVPVQMELKRIIINEVNDQQVVMLREAEGERAFPIVIGIFEATSIDRRVKGLPSPRPLTHDLTANVVHPIAAQLHANS